MAALQGAVPSNLGIMRDLYELDLSGNSLSGCLPADLQVQSALSDDLPACMHVESSHCSREAWHSEIL